VPNLDPDPIFCWPHHRSINIAFWIVLCRRRQRLHWLAPATILLASISSNGDEEIPPKPKETSLQRMRRRKINILEKRKQKNTSYLFAVWYILSIGFNIYSKRALNLAPNLAWTTCCMQMALGLGYVLPLWSLGFRDRPKLSVPEIGRLVPVAVLHSLVHIGGVISMGAGAVSFTYIVKASEPAVSCLLSAVFTGALLPLSVYLTLLPVMGGVALASVSELTFTWKSFNYAMLSNIASASRGIVGKRAINKRLGKSMTPSNLYAVLTIMATGLLMPLAWMIEGSVWKSGFESLATSGTMAGYCINTVLSSFCYYGYNEVSFMALDNVSPVSHAIGNTLKRVFIILSSMLVFGNKMDVRGITGSTLAVGGVLLYSLEKQRHAKR
jgi:solute carrier family 35, member E1